MGLILSNLLNAWMLVINVPGKVTMDSRDNFQGMSNANRLENNLALFLMHRFEPLQRVHTVLSSEKVEQSKGHVNNIPAMQFWTGTPINLCYH